MPVELPIEAVIKLQLLAELTSREPVQVLCDALDREYDAVVTPLRAAYKGQPPDAALVAQVRKALGELAASPVTMDQVLGRLGMSGRSAQRRIGIVLRFLGYTKRQVTVGGARDRWWFAPATAVSASDSRIPSEE